jgi:hypothetical protein
VRLYRIVDFYELMETIREEKLRVPSARGFSDPNELIGILFATLRHPLFSPHTQEGVDQLISDQQLMKESHYISCWTETRDSIAMWEIYSPTRTSVQIEVDDSAVMASLMEFFRENSFAKGHGAPANHPETFFYPPERGECRYVDLFSLYVNLKSRWDKYESASEEAVKNSDMSKFYDLHSHMVEEAQKEWKELGFSKDIAYAHEKEVRFLLHGARRNERAYEDCKNDSNFILFDTHLRPSTCEETGENVFADFPRSHVKKVYLDGRAPDWLAKIQTKLIMEHGIEVSRSPAYGSFLSQIPIARWYS